ncbi:hypothetical protein Nm8I071_22140 [Nonomuraea sp. TT08I-71]|nr:hypothetical protein Nm8I071_22140 [Nonomuraea sp. TT08I-71]
MKSFEDHIYLPVPEGQALPLISGVLARFEGAKHVETVDAGLIRVAVSASFESWGEVITCRLTPAEGGVKVTVRSDSKFALTMTDWGKNRRNVSKLLRRIEASISEVGLR